MPNEETIEAIIQHVEELGGIDAQAVRNGLEVCKLHRQTESAIEADLAKWGLSARQVEILESLFFRPDGTVTPAELSDEVGLTRSAMTSALDSLEQPGHIVRSPHASDRRMVTISLTPSGREFIEQRLPERYSRIARITNQISLKDRKTMVRVYTRILEVVVEDLREQAE